MVKISDALLSDLKNRGFGGANFVKTYWNLFIESNRCEEVAITASGLDDFLKRIDPNTARAAVYVVLSIKRGEMLASLLGDALQPGATVLDVGCGFGGFLVAAARRGTKVSGIELSDLRRDTAEALLIDNGIDPDVRAMDVYSDEFKSLNQMDAIISENVIEHVADPQRFMSRLVDKLAPGGILYLEIPNKDSIQIVAKDPHYHMPIISQLPHHSARALFEQVKGKDVYGMGYGVEEYHPLAWYLNILLKRDMQVQVSTRGDALAKPSEIDTYLAVVKMLSTDAKKIYPMIDAHLSDQIERVSREYLRHIAEAQNDAGMAGMLVLRFLSAAWCLTARQTP